jgi:lysophospholipase
MVMPVHNFHQPLIHDMTEASVGYHPGNGTARMRYALLWPKGKARGTVLIAPGRREFIEKKYREIGEGLLDRGYRLVMFEWRGQGLSDRFLDGDKRQRDHSVDFTTHMHDLTSFMDSVVRPNQQGPLIFCGHSMGSHLLLRWMMEHPGQDIAAAILVAPMVALAGQMPHMSANIVSWSATKLGYGDDYAYGQHNYSDEDKKFDGNPLSRDATRFAILERYFKSYPDMRVGGVTWDWLHASIQSMQITQRRSHLESFAYPVLSLTGSDDRVTPFDETHRFMSLIPKAENFKIDGALHDVMGEVEPCRFEAWKKIDRLLTRIAWPVS